MSGLSNEVREALLLLHWDTCTLDACLCGVDRRIAVAEDLIHQAEARGAAAVVERVEADFKRRADEADRRDDPNSYARRVVWDRARELLRAALDRPRPIEEEKAGAAEVLESAVEAVLVTNGRRNGVVTQEFADALDRLLRCRYGTRPHALTQDAES